jgi:TRAP-type C4-dicarboxylate transport system substrate-binding protein
MNFRSLPTHTCAIFTVTIVMSFALPAQAQTRMRMGTLVPKGTSYHRLLLGMAEQWRKAPGGGINLTIYADGTMGGEAEMVRRMRVGQLQAAMLTVPGLAEIDSSVGALQKIPMAYRSLEEARYVRERMRPLLEQRLLEKGFVVLFWGDAGWVRMFTKRPGYRPSDFRTMKMFVAAGDIAQADVMKAAGFQPVPLEYTDTFTGLQTGMIDAVPTLPFYALSGQFYSITPHMLELNWVPLVGAIVVTKKSWESLPQETRQAMLAAAETTGESIQSQSQIEGEESVKAMQQRGLQVHAVPKALEDEWRSAAEAYYPEIRGAIVPADAFDQVRRVVQEYRSRGQSANKDRK